MLEFERDGAELFVSVVEADVLALLRDEFNSLYLKAGGRSFDLSPIVLALLSPSGGIGRVAAGLSGGRGRPVRVLAFDKTPHDNWHLGWHQDRVIAAKEPTHRRVLHVDYCSCSLPDRLDRALDIIPDTT